MIWHPDNIILGPVQSNPTAWAKVRRGKVTGSRFDDIMAEPKTPPRKFVQDHMHLVAEALRYKILKTGPRAGQKVEADGLGQMVIEAAERNGTYCWGESARGYMMEIVAAAVTGRDKVGGKSAAMDHGNDTEADAFDHYAAVNFADVRKAQMLIIRDTRIAATPDGFVEDHSDGPGLLEIKCPESKTHLSHVDGPGTARSVLLPGAGPAMGERPPVVRLRFLRQPLPAFHVDGADPGAAGRGVHRQDGGTGAGVCGRGGRPPGSHLRIP
jgi:hypothetical protein